MTYMLDTNICIYVMKKKPEGGAPALPAGNRTAACASRRHPGGAGVWGAKQLRPHPQRAGAAPLSGPAEAFCPLAPRRRPNMGRSGPSCKRRARRRPAGYADRGPTPREGLTLVTNNTGEFAPRAGAGAGKLGGINQEPRPRVGLFAARSKKALSRSGQGSFCVVFAPPDAAAGFRTGRCGSLCGSASGSAFRAPPDRSAASPAGYGIPAYACNSGSW